MKRLALLALLALAGCHKSWPDDQALRVTNSVKSWVMVEQFCRGPDVSLCTPANIMGLAHASVCPEASGLYQHGDPLPPLAPEACPVPK